MRRALDGVDDQTEGRLGPSDFPASLPDFVPHLVVNVDGEDVGLAVVVAGNDAQELAGRVVGDCDRHVGQLVDKQSENEFLVRHADRTVGELLDVGDERPFLRAAVADQVELEALGIVEDPDWRGMVLNQAGQREGWRGWGRLEDAGIHVAVVVLVTVVAAGVVLRRGGVSSGVYQQDNADHKCKRD